MSDPSPKRPAAPIQKIEVHGGEPVIVQKARDVHVHPGEHAAPKDFAGIVEAARPYLALMATECRRLPLRGLDPKASDPLTKGKLGLDSVYVGLDTTADVEEEEQHAVGGGTSGLTLHGLQAERRPLSALRAVSENPQVVLLGNPGSGKTTFLNHFALCLARRHLEPNGPWLARLTDWPAEQCEWIPILFTLRRFVAYAHTARTGDDQPLPEAGAEILWDYLSSTLHKDACFHCIEALRAAAELGMALVFLDGLDEVATDELRIFVRDCAQKFATRYPKARLVLTCRVIPYQNPAWQLPGIPTFQLRPFDDAKIEAFVRAWFNAHRDDCGMPPAQADAKALRLQSALKDPRRAEMHALAGNPMLLTVMALLQSDHRELPENRAELYEEVIKLLLRRWDETHGDDGAPVAGISQLLDEVRADLNDLQRVLWSLAFRAQKACQGRADDAVADIPRFDLLKALKRLHPKRDLGWANRVVEAIKERSGLLLEESEDVFRFPHRSFQEYLAAAFLLDGDDESEEPTASESAPEPIRFPQNALMLVDGSGYWHEVIQWAAGRVTHVLNRPNECLALLAELCPDSEAQGAHPWHRAWLAGEALVEMRKEKAAKSRHGAQLMSRIVGQLERLIDTGQLTPRERVRAGAALGILGDGRHGVGCRPATHSSVRLPDIAWILIEKGPFTMGATKFDRERPQFLCHLIRQSYAISRFPITVAQYEAFIADGGYTTESFWTDAGRAWRRENQIQRPEDFSLVFQTPNHPRVGVSWYEATAYARWLHLHRSTLDIPQNWAIHLPSEAQWERAARWTDGREFPWLDRGDLHDHCNHGMHLGHTSAVGMYPKGRSKDGADDMAGNVWEWCATKWQGSYRQYESKVDDDPDGQEDRVVRGGSWDSGTELVRCAYRLSFDPRLRIFFLGFRVAATPFL